MASASVNRPTDEEARDKNIEQKLRLYGIFTAFKNGKVPSNEQIDIAFNSFCMSDLLSDAKGSNQKLSLEGRKMMAEFRQLLRDLQNLFLSKNEGNLIQDFIWQTQQIDGGNAGVPGAPVDGQTAKQHGNEALEGLRTLGSLLISNGQFRKLLNDATILLRDMAGDAAEKTASKINPSQEQLSQVDKPAEDNVWHENPSGSQIKDQVKSTFNKNKPFSQEDVQGAASNAYQANESPDMNAQTAANTAANALKSSASDNVPDETKDKMRESKARTQERTKQYLSSKFPDDRREQLIYRVKKMVIECQGHTDYQQAVTTLLNLAEQYVGHANNLGQQAAGSVQGAHQDTALQSAEKDLKTVIERYANNTSTDDLFEAINAVYRDADSDPDLKTWFRSMDRYIRKCLQEQGYIMEDASTEEWNKLYERGNYLLRERYRGHTNRIIDEVNFLIDQFKQDQLNKKFGNAITQLFKDLGTDKDGKTTFKPHLLKDVTDVIIPETLEGLGYVPIPRIEYTDPTMDVVIENLVVESDNLMPNLVEFYGENTKRWGRNDIANVSKHSIEFKMAGIQMDLHDVSYYVNRKQGHKMKDQGVVDLFLGGTGLSFTINMATAQEDDRQNFFKIDKVVVDVKNLKIKIKSSKHKILFTAVKGILLKLLRPALQKLLEQVIKDKAHQLDSFLFEVKQEVDRAQQQVMSDPGNAPNIYNRYFTAFQKKLTEGKQKTAEVQARAEQTRVNIAWTLEDSIFPDIILQNGISTKATKYLNFAKQGERWESPVFTFPNVAKSKGIPPAEPVTRKSHGANNTSVRFDQNPVQQMGSSNTGFGKQVDQALGDHSGSGNLSTTLGQGNPVLTGAAPATGSNF